ncbi:unnamed protein product [Effrenium voratum]|nr:unnamed protein product [Effrenium voratum]
MLKALSLGFLAVVVQADLAALPSDDECASGQCALNALQVRSQEGVDSNEDMAASLNESAAIAVELNQTGKLWKLYHATSPDIGPQILKNGFRSGHSGWCGGAIYFGNSAQETKWKAVGADSHQGYIIEAMVDVGHVKKMPWNCYTSSSCIASHPSFEGHVGCLSHHYYGHQVHKEGYNSIVFNPGDGYEVVIWDKHQVKSMRHI